MAHYFFSRRRFNSGSRDTSVESHKRIRLQQVSARLATGLRDYDRTIMAKKKNRDTSDENTAIKLLELQCAVMQHCQALRAVTNLLIEGKKDAAVARLDQATAAFSAVVRGQCVGVTMKCPACGSEQDVVAWVDDHNCHNCGTTLEMPEASQ